MSSAIAKLNDYGQSPWYDNLSRTLLRGWRAREARCRRRHARRHVQPDHPRQGDRRRRALRRAAPAMRGRRDVDRRHLLGRRPARHRRRRRRAAARARCDRRSRRLRVGGGFSRARARHRRHQGSRAVAVRTGRPSQRDDQDPGHAGRAARDRRHHRRGHQRERHTDLLPRPARQGHRRVPGRPATPRRGGRRPLDGALGGVVLREPRRHRNRPAPARGSRAPGQGGSGERQARVRAVPAALLGSRVGGARGEGREPAAAVVGVDVHQEPGLLVRRSTSTSSSARTP